MNGKKVICNSGLERNNNRKPRACDSLCQHVSFLVHLILCFSPRIHGVHEYQLVMGDVNFAWNAQRQGR